MSRRRTTRTPRPTPAARVCETPRCDNPAADGWGICRGCYSATAGRLSDLGGPWLVELGITLTGRSQIGPESVGGRSAETALPLSLSEWAAQGDHRIEDWPDAWGRYRSWYVPPGADKL